MIDRYRSQCDNRTYNLGQCGNRTEWYRYRSHCGYRTITGHSMVTRQAGTGHSLVTGQIGTDHSVVTGQLLITVW